MSRSKKHRGEESYWVITPASVITLQVLSFVAGALCGAGAVLLVAL